MNGEGDFVQRALPEGGGGDGVQRDLHLEFDVQSLTASSDENIR